MGIVIKAGQAARMQHRFKGLAVNDHIAEAKTLLANARQESQDIIDQTHAEARLVREQARKKGFAEGMADGTRTGQKTGHDEAYANVIAKYDAQIQQLVGVLNQTVSNVDQAKDDLLLVAEKELQRFAFGVARRITKQIASESESSAIENAKQAIELVGRNTDISVRVNQADADAMKRFAKEAGNDLSNATHIRLVVDDNVERGGCIVDSPSGRIDATISEQLAQAEKLLFGETITREKT